MARMSSYHKRRLFSSYFWVVISLFLVLFLLGLCGFFVLNSQKLADFFREQVPMSIYFKEGAKKANMQQMVKSLQMADYTKSAIFVSSEEGAEQAKKDLGEDFIDQLDGFNPIPNSIDLRLNASFVSNDEIAEIAATLEKNKAVHEVSYDRPLVDLLNNNVRRISFWMLIVCGVFAFIAFLLINSSIRLSVYAKRFTIKTMQMVGATKGFIRKPFIMTSLRLGFLGGLLAIIGMAVVVYYADQYIPKLGILQDYTALGILGGGIMLFGLFISLLSTFFATTRYLNLRTDQLYY